MSLPLSLDPKTWGDRKWRLHNLYWVKNKRGKRVRFRPWAAQLDLLDNLWYLNIILKSRQRGFSTFIDMLGLDLAVFAKHQNVGIIAHGLREASEIFVSKVKFPYDNLPEGIKEIVFPHTYSKTELELDNGSAVRVGTSMRSGTYQFLHITEFGKISVKYPERAKEIVTGAFNTVASGQYIFVESTAEGRDGYFYKMCEAAKKKWMAQEKLTPLDFRFHFYPWWTDRDCEIDPAGVSIPGRFATYFQDLAELGIKTTPAQRAWYVKKAEGQEDDMKREYPATPEEAFEAAVKGAILGKQMQWLRAMNRIRQVDPVPSQPVNTFWDLGRNDMNAIWFHQYIAGEHRFWNFYQNHLEDLAHYYGVMQDIKAKYRIFWGKHYLPHDADNQNLERNESRVDRLDELGLPKSTIVVVPRIDELTTGLETLRKMMPLAWIEKSRCDEGITCLDSYQWTYDDVTGQFKHPPAKNGAQHAADALRQWAQGWRPPKDQPKPTTRVRRPHDAGVGY